MCSIKMDKKYVTKIAKKAKGQTWFSEKYGWMYSYELGDIFLVENEKMVSKHHDLDEFEKTYLPVKLIADFSGPEKCTIGEFLRKFKTNE